MDQLRYCFLEIEPIGLSGVSDTIFKTNTNSLQENIGAISQKPDASISKSTESEYAVSGWETV